MSTESSTVPRIASSSFWKSLVPKAFRKADDPVSVAERAKAKAIKSTKSKEWNPATFFIIMSLLIGSNAINMISLRNSRLNYSRKAEAKIAVLREVIRRVQNGEDVDVERMLGTGDPEQEKEWEEVMKEVESGDTLWETKQRKKAEKNQAKTVKEAAKQSAISQEVSESSGAATSSAPAANRRPGFY